MSQLKTSCHRFKKKNSENAPLCRLQFMYMYCTEMKITVAMVTMILLFQKVLKKPVVVDQGIHDEGKQLKVWGGGEPQIHQPE